MSESMGRAVCSLQDRLNAANAETHHSQRCHAQIRGLVKHAIEVVESARWTQGHMLDVLGRIEQLASEGGDLDD